MSDDIQQHTKYLRDLRRSMLATFSIDEMQVLAFDLSVDWDSLAGNTKPLKSQSLIMHLTHRGRLQDLVDILCEERPNVDWPDLPSAEKQIRDEKLITPGPLRDYLNQMVRLDFSKPADRAYGKLMTAETLNKLRELQRFDHITTAIEC